MRLSLAAAKGLTCKMPLLPGRVAGRYRACSSKGKWWWTVLAMTSLGCRPDPGPSVTSSNTPTASADAVSGTTAPATASAVAPAPTASAKVIEPLTRDERGLLGKTIDFEYDGKDVNDKSRAY